MKPPIVQTITPTVIVPSEDTIMSTSGCNNNGVLNINNNCSIKASVSMTSLPPPSSNGQNDTLDMGQAKLRLIDRPYNSLKKKRTAERETWRRSWESGHSHSSCSLQSNATNNGSGTGKDDFWAALQTNYNYIMDTNLLDKCREARGEIEGDVVPEFKIPDCCEKSLCQSSKSQGSPGDPRRLRRWLREMENRMSLTPTISEAMKMKTGELQKRLTEHSELYREIVSQTRTVNACIRTCQQQLQEQQKENDKKNIITTGDNIINKPITKQQQTGYRKGDSNLKGLERRYHLLYLKAFEVQCLLESLIGRKNSSASDSHSPYDTDEEPAAKLARLTDSTKLDKDTNQEKDNYFNIDYVDDNRSDDEWPSSYLGCHPLVQSVQAAGFEADSEGSDCEIIPKVVATTVAVSSLNSLEVASGNNSGTAAKLNKSINCFDESMMDTENNFNDNTLIAIDALDIPATTTNTKAANTSSPLKNINNNNNNNYISDNNNLDNSLNRTVIKRSRHQIDVSKFNHSNRKSKHCATFYFKHLDTDSDQRGLSSQGSEVFKSDEPSSEDDEWTFSNGNNKNNNINKMNDCIVSGGINGESNSDDYENGNDIVMEETIKANYINNLSPTNNKIIKTTKITRNTINDNKTPDSEEMSLSYDDVDGVNDFITINGNTSDDTQLNEAKDSNSNSNGTDTTSIMYKHNGGELTKFHRNLSIGGSCCTGDNIDNYRNNKIINKQHYSKESIQQLVLGAEYLVREDNFLMKQQQPKKNLNKNSFSETLITSSISSTGTKVKCDKNSVMSNYPKIKRVQEWLEHQPLGGQTLPPLSAPTTDCDASGEYTESDSAARDSDTSEGLADSIATCLQGGNSQATSIDVIGGSAEPLPTEISVQQNGKVIMRNSNRRNSERPWSVSCLSQLTQKSTTSRSETNVNNQGLANFSISESALHTLSSNTTNNKEEAQTSTMKNSYSRNSLKKRRMRIRKRAGGRKSDSGSEGCPLDLSRVLSKSIVKSESFSGPTNLAHDLMALSLLSKQSRKHLDMKSTSSEMESEEENAMMKPNFKLGSYTNVFPPASLGSLAALANYNNDVAGEQIVENVEETITTGTEDLSSFSEQWDNYQEKYMSEPYSECFDSDGARRILEFGDDYRNFIDSQSDCCSSSLSAANNFDSMSPPRLTRTQISPETNKLAIKDHANIGTSSIVSLESLRRRTIEAIENEKKKKSSLDGTKKRSSDERRRSWGTEPSSVASNRLSPKSQKVLDQYSVRHQQNKHDHNDNYHTNRKLEFSPNHSEKNRRKYSESDNSSSRRRSIRSVDKFGTSFNTLPSSSSSSDSEDDSEMRNFLTQSRNRLENTEALHIRRHLLRPEDYAEIIETCRDNVHCLEAVLRGPPSTMLKQQRYHETRDLLSSWESLLSWSENASVARQLQDEMSTLKGALSRLGSQLNSFDSELAIHDAIDELKNDKTQLHNHRSTMLKLNASVHSWLTRQELKMSKQLEKSKINDETNIDGQNIIVGVTEVITDLDRTLTEKGAQFEEYFVDAELHKQLKEEVGDMYRIWDEADQRITSRLDNLTTSVTAWKQFESGLTEFQEALGKDRGALCGLKGALECGKTTPTDLAHDVKEVAKLLNDKIENGAQNLLQAAAMAAAAAASATSGSINGDNSIGIQNLHPSAALIFGIKSSSNGSLSDSGISDGGGVSDGGLSERERRLGALRRLARQLENALAPGSEALKSISQRMETAEAELRALQDTCRELIVRTAVQQHQNGQVGRNQTNPNGNGKGKAKRSPQSKRKNKRRLSGSPDGNTTNQQQQQQKQQQQLKGTELFGNLITITSSPGGPDDPRDNNSIILNKIDDIDIDELDDDGKKRRGWLWRVAKFAFPVQVAIITLLCAACLLEPHCCDALNNLSMSFTPQLRYVRGPPPV